MDILTLHNGNNVEQDRPAHTRISCDPFKTSVKLKLIRRLVQNCQAVKNRSVVKGWDWRAHGGLGWLRPAQKVTTNMNV